MTNFEWPKRKFYDKIGAHSMYIEYCVLQYKMPAVFGLSY